jgi:hypothetical protein
MNRLIKRMALLAAVCLAHAPAGADEAEIAGVAPDQRPARAPSVTQVGKSAEWYCRALTGIDRPYPASLRFLEDQGGWHSPFIVAGMTGRYDIRNWHASSACAKR